MAIDTSKVILPSVIPYGLGFQQDTVQASNVPLMLMKPESADLIKQKADSDALAQPATTQVAIGVDGMAPADKAKKPNKPKKQAAPVVQEPVVAASASAPAQGSQATSSEPATTGLNANTNKSDDGNPYGSSDSVVSDTPDTTDVVNHPYDDERKNIHTLFQTLTGKDAIPYGQKWRWYLQHGFTGMHGGLHQELMNQVNAENSAFGGGAGKNTYGQELRAQEMKRKTLMQQWDKLLWEWNHGYYSGDSTSVKKFYDNANRLRNAMIAEGISPDLIRDPSINAGGFAQGFQKDVSNLRNKMDWLGGWMQTIEDNIAENPDWLNSIQATAEFDKMSEYVILNWAQSKGAIADAEKIRAQVESMPKQDRAYYNGFMSAFFRGNAFTQTQALAQAGNQHAKELVAELKRLANFDPKDAETVGGEVKGKTGNRIMQLVELVRLDLAGNNLDLPQDLATALQAYKNGKEAFDDYVMKNANVDREMVWNSAADQLKILKNSYDRMIQKGGLYQGWGYDGYLANKDLSTVLRDWQANDPTNSVIRNAKFGSGTMAGDTNDGFGKGKVNGGGAGATAGDDIDVLPDPPQELIGKNAYWSKKNKSWYYFDKNGNRKKYGG